MKRRNSVELSTRCRESRRSQGRHFHASRVGYDVGTGFLGALRFAYISRGALVQVFSGVPPLAQANRKPTSPDACFSGYGRG